MSGAQWLLALLRVGAVCWLALPFVPLLVRLVIAIALAALFLP